MNKINKRSGLAVFNDSPALFKYPIPETILLTDNNLPELFKKIDNLNDHRLLSIVTALIIEDRTDQILSLLLPNYKKLQKNAGFTFSTKLDLLESFNIIPKQILNAADSLRKIRNEFAHHLEIDTFERIDGKLMGKIISRQKDYHPLPAGDPSETSYYESFKRLSTFCIICLEVFKGNIVLFTKTIYSSQFIESLTTDLKSGIDNLLMKQKDKESKLSES